MNTDFKKIPHGWRLSTVGSECKICNNLREPLSEEERSTMQGTYPYYGPTKAVDYLDRFRVEGTYALIGEDGDHFLKYNYQDMTQLVSGRFNINNHAHLVQGGSECSTEWFYTFFRHRSIAPFLTRQGAGRYKLNKAALERIPFLIPPKAEQDIIHSAITRWDYYINLIERLLTAKQERRTWLMQQLLTGKRRLPKFNSPWNEVRVRELLAVRTEKSAASESEPLYSLTIENGITPKTDRYDREALVKDKKAKLYKKVYQGDLVFNPSNLRWGAIARSKVNFSVLVSPIYEVLYVKKPARTDMEFVSQVLCSARQIAKFASQTEGTLIERMAVKIEPFLSTHIRIPSEYTEQKAISNVFKTVNRELDLLRSQLEALRKQKKGLMQQLLTGKIRVKM